jgi:aspartyl-tRNA(Asn)/glutamyl-tRNA(Gln) amidotransferase subunit C
MNFCAGFIANACADIIGVFGKPCQMSCGWPMVWICFYKNERRAAKMTKTAQLEQVSDAKCLQRGAARGKRGAEMMEPYMSITTETAAKVAKLARIRVEEDALPALAQEFNNILGFIEQLNEVDVEGVEPMTSVTPQRLKRRVDGVTDGNQQDKVLKNAPDAREGFFAVPKVVE